MNKKTSLTYRDAGVDIDAGNELVQRIKTSVESTRRAEVLSGIGAEPLFFLDYYATSRLELEVAEAVVAGIAHGCRQAGAALIGGETAEMPGIYQPGDYDLAGFCVGIVEREQIIDGSGAQPGDCVIGLASSGPHSNGYSLVRKIIEVSAADLDAHLCQASS